MWFLYSLNRESALLIRYYSHTLHWPLGKIHQVSQTASSTEVISHFLFPQNIKNWSQPRKNHCLTIASHLALNCVAVLHWNVSFHSHFLLSSCGFKSSLLWLVSAKASRCFTAAFQRTSPATPSSCRLSPRSSTTTQCSHASSLGFWPARRSS